MSANVSVEDDVINGGNVDVKLMPKSTRESSSLESTLSSLSEEMRDAWGRSSLQQGGYSIGDHAPEVGLFDDAVTRENLRAVAYSAGYQDGYENGSIGSALMSHRESGRDAFAACLNAFISITGKSSLSGEEVGKIVFSARYLSDAVLVAQDVDSEKVGIDPCLRCGVSSSPASAG